MNARTHLGNAAELDTADLDDGLAEATRLFRDIHLGWTERSIEPDPEWRASDLAGTIGDHGVGIAAAVRDFERWIVPGAVGSPAPRYMGLVNSSPLPAGPIADLLVSALDNNASADHHAPSALAAEREIVRVFGRLFLGRDDSGGMVLPGGSFATLQALLTARARAFPEWEREGPSAVVGRPLVYLSDATHFSGARAAHLAGVGRAGVRRVPTEGRGAMRPGALAEMIRQDRAAGGRPFAVIGTTGTTGTGALDPVAALADIAQAENLWLHVDACYGGGAALLPDLREHFDPVGRADSVAVDPHKWFFAPLTCSILLLASEPPVVEPFDIDNSYIPASGPPPPWRRGMATSRRATGLALWTMLRAHGFAAVRAAVAENIRQTRRLETHLARAGFEVLPGGALSVCCARWAPDGERGPDVDALQERISHGVVASDRAWLSTVRHDDRTWLRLNILNLSTTDAVVDDVALAIAEETQRLVGSEGGDPQPPVEIRSDSLKKNEISRAAFSSESEAWMAFRPLDSA
jgi:aromatic-L-amino-acid decarboxylase